MQWQAAPASRVAGVLRRSQLVALTLASLATLCMCLGTAATVVAATERGHHCMLVSSYQADEGAGLRVSRAGDSIVMLIDGWVRTVEVNDFSRAVADLRAGWKSYFTEYPAFERQGVLPSEPARVDGRRIVDRYQMHYVYGPRDRLYVIFSLGGAPRGCPRSDARRPARRHRQPQQASFVSIEGLDTIDEALRCLESLVDESAP